MNGEGFAYFRLTRLRSKATTGEIMLRFIGRRICGLLWHKWEGTWIDDNGAMMEEKCFRCGDVRHFTEWSPEHPDCVIWKSGPHPLATDAKRTRMPRRDYLQRVR